MKILGIESSCDETSAAVVENGRKVLSNVIASQIKLHAKTGGVVPEVAAREHVEKIIPVIEKALKDAKTKMEKIDAIAVAYGPGLISSLLIGTSAANMMSMLLDKPLIGVKHILGHVYAPFLESKGTPQFPILSLSVSGGHNELFYMRDHFDFDVLGETVDDAAGEAFDKVARMLGLAYPGGPAIEALAKKGNPLAISFPKAKFENPESLDFSFSGLKTSVQYFLEKRVKSRKKVTPKEKADIAASFQKAVIDALVGNVLKALARFPDVREVHLTGGVSANMALRTTLEKDLLSIKTGKSGLFGAKKIVFRTPMKMSYCTDNGAMIAGAAYFQHEKNPHKYRDWKFVEATAQF
jgi:N6-L-threonylcarbamoyladenine synthase